MTRARIAVVLALLIVGGLAPLLRAGHGRRFWYPAYLRVVGPRTLDDVLRRIGPARRTQLRTLCDEAGLTYPPAAVALLAFKHERLVEVWAARGAGHVLLTSYPVLAASGGPGPKLRRGDLQVPEGLYRLTGLNPNSSYHLSIRVDYPNAFDRAKARLDGRSDLGGDIFIHGKAVSIGCLALGDEAIEELFTLAADVGLRRTRLVIAPGRERVVPDGAPAWVGELYREIDSEVGRVRGGVVPGAGP